MNTKSQENPPHTPHGESVVAIFVNNKEFHIHRGHQTVVNIKKTGEVPLADDLEEVVAGKLVPLSDDGAVTIKGDERFISHPKDSGSS